MTLTIHRLRGIALAAVLVLAPTVAWAQDSKSAPSVTELVKMLDSMKLDSFAIKGASPNEYIGALYFQGSQLLVVTAKFDTPWRADSLLEMKNYRDLYIELNSASLPQTKVFISDLGANGLGPRKDDNICDTADVGGKTYNFDGDWKKEKITEEDHSRMSTRSVQQRTSVIKRLREC